MRMILIIYKLTALCIDLAQTPVNELTHTPGSAQRRHLGTPGFAQGRRGVLVALERLGNGSPPLNESMHHARVDFKVNRHLSH
ncbi:MAG: hypothetical protein RL357_818, partial [Pseudomonadota bacterium]